MALRGSISSRSMKDARVSPALIRAYRETSFVVLARPRSIVIRVGRRNGRLDAWLKRRGANRWAFITAWNPASRQLQPSENRRRNARLAAEARKAGLTVVRGVGVPASPEWTPEQSFLVFDVSEPEARRLGAHYGQHAVAAGRRGGNARLLRCASSLGHNARPL